MMEEGYYIVRLEREQQRQMSIQKPREEKKVLERLIRALELSPKFAEKVFYSIPYKQKDGTKKNVEGISIKGAMAIQRIWGNCASACRVVAEKDDRIICEGAFLDYETNSRVMREVAVSRFYKPEGGNMMQPLR